MEGSDPVIREFSLEGRVAIVTGGTRSIGREIAKAMAEAGARVVICGRSRERLETVESEISAMGGEVLPVECDVSDAADVDRLVHAAKRRFGRIDSLIANAGVFQSWDASENVGTDEYDRVMAINARGAWLCCRAAGAEMIAAGSGGTVIAVASIQGLVGVPGTAVYTASKHAVVGMAKVLALDWARYGIRVNTIAPGFVERDGEPLKHDPTAMEFVRDNTPLGRMGTPREVGAVAVFLASDASSYITGTTLAVDGGWLAR